MVMTDEEKLATAYHETGHAIVNLELPECDPLHKVTIIPRGRALGVTMALPEKDRYSYTKGWMESRIAMCFGGRIAEQLIYGESHLNSGAADDIRQATAMARRMVTEFGMSEKLGPLRYSENEEEVFLGHSVTQRKNVSEATAKVIDEEIRRIIDEGELKARTILTEHIDELHALAKGLLEFETLSVDEIKRIIRGEKIVRDTGGPVEEPPRTPGRRSSVPPAGRDKPAGGFEPEPQPGG
jgi:cell division protease FtsH